MGQEDRFRINFCWNCRNRDGRLHALSAFTCSPIRAQTRHQSDMFLWANLPLFSDFRCAVSMGSTARPRTSQPTVIFNGGYNLCVVKLYGHYCLVRVVLCDRISYARSSCCCIFCAFDVLWFVAHPAGVFGLQVRHKHVLECYQCGSLPQPDDRRAVFFCAKCPRKTCLSCQKNGGSCTSDERAGWVSSCNANKCFNV